ncbi:hypothetical protein B0T14DRAFT_522660 [Immersiella caudata]|uniref:Uncharacterized protein n=1 Tax=Immersiella caudata TaxID=314043 RepID=A0AA39WIS1_9PEZI|nr:hypothetical protein B0T14DRAFT_522660 [Immersiella caudata]
MGFCRFCWILRFCTSLSLFPFFGHSFTPFLHFSSMIRLFFTASLLFWSFVTSASSLELGVHAHGEKLSGILEVLIRVILVWL